MSITNWHMPKTDWRIMASTSFDQVFPIWNRLSAEEQATLGAAAFPRRVGAGTILHEGGADCVGLLVVASGQLRAFIRSEEGKQVTLYRLLEGDVCLLSASCVLRDIQFKITVEAERDSELWVIPSEVYGRLVATSSVVANYANQLMASRLTDVMWLVEQVMWKSFDRRLAAFLLEESSLEGSECLHITHERIAEHMGSAREVVTRMLRYLQGEGMVEVGRGQVRLVDVPGLRVLAA